MDTARKKRLESKGWKFGTVQEFLGLTDAETALIELHLSLAKSVRERRLKLGLTQVEVAKRLGSSQARVAKMESADPSVSLDLFISSLLKLGVSRSEVGRVIGRAA